MRRHRTGPPIAARLWPVLALAGMAAGLPGCAARPLRLDADPASGFAVYKSGQLSRRDLAGLCAAGIEEIAVLAGSGRARECALREAAGCRPLRLVYDVRQEAGEPLDAGFLAAFDRWVEQARRDGRRIALRCRHGWHRAGRLAAWYRLRFLGWQPADAIAAMEREGRFMGRHPELAPQVQALADFLAGLPCSTAPQHCVRPPAGDGPFARDLCPAPAGSSP